MPSLYAMRAVVASNYPISGFTRRGSIMEFVPYIFIAIAAVFFAVVCRNMAVSRNGNPTTWVVLRFVFGILAVIATSIMGHQSRRPAPPIR